MKCKGCIFLGTYQDMGSSCDVCKLQDELVNAIKACKCSADCLCKITVEESKVLCRTLARRHLETGEQPMELNREQIVRAMECCVEAKIHGDCIRLDCPALKNGGCIYEAGTDEEGDRKQLADVLVVYRELIEENERLKAENAEQDEAIIKALQRMGELRRETQAEAVHKTISRIKIKCQRVAYADMAVPKVNHEIFTIKGEELDEIEKELTNVYQSKNQRRQ